MKIYLNLKNSKFWKYMNALITTHTWIFSMVLEFLRCRPIYEINVRLTILVMTLSLIYKKYKLCMNFCRYFVDFTKGKGSLFCCLLEVLIALQQLTNSFSKALSMLRILFSVIAFNSLQTAPKCNFCILVKQPYFSISFYHLLPVLSSYR